jgi:hypothetical protein
VEPSSTTRSSKSRQVWASTEATASFTAAARLYVGIMTLTRGTIQESYQKVRKIQGVMIKNIGWDNQVRLVCP